MNKELQKEGVETICNLSGMEMAHFRRYAIATSSLANLGPAAGNLEVQKRRQCLNLDADLLPLQPLGEILPPMGPIVSISHASATFHLAKELDPSGDCFCWRLADVTIGLCDHREWFAFDLVGIGRSNVLPQDLKGSRCSAACVWLCKVL